MRVEVILHPRVPGGKRVPRPPRSQLGFGHRLLPRDFPASCAIVYNPLDWQARRKRITMLRKTGLVAILLFAPFSPLSAQWPNLKDKLPRNKDGSPNLTAPAPHRADGKPDLTGIWLAVPAKLRDATVGLKPDEVQM